MGGKRLPKKLGFIDFGFGLQLTKEEYTEAKFLTTQARRLRSRLLRDENMVELFTSSGQALGTRGANFHESDFVLSYKPTMREKLEGYTHPISGVKYPGIRTRESFENYVSNLKAILDKDDRGRYIYVNKRVEQYKANLLKSLRENYQGYKNNQLLYRKIKGMSLSEFKRNIQSIADFSIQELYNVVYGGDQDMVEEYLKNLLESLS